MNYFISPFWYYSSKHNLLYNRASNNIEVTKSIKPDLIRPLLNDEEELFLKKIKQYRDKK